MVLTKFKMPDSMKHLALILFVALLTSSCSKVMQLSYGIKQPKLLSSEKIISKQKRYGVDPSRSYVLNPDYLLEEKKLLNDPMCVISSLNDMLQPLQVRIFDPSDSMIGFQSNCHCGGFPNLRWDRYDVFSTVKASTTVNLTDTAFVFTEDAKNYSPLGHDENITANATDYQVVIFWSAFMGRQSRRLIRIANRHFKDESNVQITYVNTDVWYGNL